jgi:hypothetical protein
MAQAQTHLSASQLSVEHIASKLNSMLAARHAPPSAPLIPERKPAVAAVPHPPGV